jgi:hypothetical protein
MSIPKTVVHHRTGYTLKKKCGACPSLSTKPWPLTCQVESPIKAPVMTVTRALLKGGDNPKEYY